MQKLEVLQIQEQDLNERQNKIQNSLKDIEVLDTLTFFKLPSETGDKLRTICTDWLADEIEETKETRGQISLWIQGLKEKDYE